MLKKIKNLLMILIACSMVSGCGNGALYEKNASGYIQQTCVESTVFDMPKAMLDQATAITAIAEDSDYSQNAFVYKNGHDTYLMFDISSIVVLVKEGTGYDFENSEDKGSSLQSEGINGIWFSPDGKKLECETDKSNGKYKTMITADADVSITPDVYGMFAGKFANVKCGDLEVSMFVGARAEAYEDLSDNQIKIIEHIAKSLNIVSAEPEENTENVILPEESTEPEAATEEITVEDTEAQETNTEAEEDVVVIENNETPPAEENQENEIPATDSVNSAEVTPEQEVTDQPEEAAPAEEKNIVSIKSNQVERNEDNLYTSSIYSMLEVGETGVLQSLSYDTANYEANYMTINAVYTGQDAVNIIKGFCDSGQAAYEYQDAPSGCSWNVIEYSLAKSQSEAYTDIWLEGLDGEKLNYRGVSYKKRTHDIFAYESKTETGYEKLYCFYAVPNGCKEYLLEAGDPGIKSVDAFFHIKLE